MSIDSRTFTEVGKGKYQKNLVIWREFAIIEVSESTSGGITGENIRGIWLISKKMSDVRA